MSNDSDTGGMPVAKPGPHHELMQPIEGTFSAEVRLFMGPGDPVISSGTMVNRWELNGLFLSQTYQGDPMGPGMPAFEGRGYWGYNDATGQYEGLWLDIATSMFQLERGTVDTTGKVWTMHGELAHPGGAGTLAKRSVFRVEGPDRHVMEQYMTFPGAPSEVKTMEIAFTRRK